MVGRATALSIALFLLPILLTLVATSERRTALWRIALTPPAIVAVDMLAIMLAARVVHLETAIFVVRALWIAAGAAMVTVRVVRDGDRPRWPEALRPSICAAALASAAIGFAISALISRPYHLWDRHWHVPLTAMIRGETIPFHNVFDPAARLHYHITGDVLGAVFQTLSLGVINSSLALSVAHDVMFALIAGTVAMLLFAFGARRIWPPLLGGVAILLQGPCSLRGKLGADYYGYSFDSLLIAGFRPHVTLAGLLIVGVLGVVALRLERDRELGRARTHLMLMACTAVLAVTDEASLGIVGLALGISWLVAPRVVAQSRLLGIAVFLAIAGGAIAANLLFGGSLSPGGPVQAIEWMPARSPGTQSFAPLPLSTHDGRVALFCDLLPTLLCGLGLALGALRRPRVWGALAFVGAALAISIVLFTKLEVNHSHFEAQRFLIAPCFVALLFGMLFVTRRPSQLASGSLASVCVWLGLALSAFSTIAWIRQRATDFSDERADAQNPNLHEMDCRRSTLARLGESPTPVFFEPSVFGAYTGCHPSYAAGKLDPEWGIKIFPELDSMQQLATLDSEIVAKDKDLVAICASPPSTDPVCRAAEKRRRCYRDGEDVRRCTLAPEDRRAILNR